MAHTNGVSSTLPEIGGSEIVTPASNGLPCAVVALDRTDNIVAYSPAAARMLGLNPDGPGPKADLDGWLPRALGHGRTRLNTAGQARFSITRGPETLDVTLAPWQSANGGSLGTVLTFERPVRGADAQKALRSMAANLAHEIRNPLGTIRATVQLFGADCPVANPVCRESLNIIQEETDRINALIRELIAFSSPGSALFEPIRVNQLLSNVAEEIRQRAARDRVSVLLDLTPEECVISGDERALRECLARLCANSFAAMAMDGRLILRSRAAGERVVVEVEDTGEGIEAGNIGHMFEPFYSTRANGIGLGLALVRAIIEQHSGSVGITSERGHGTCCAMEFPVREGGR